MVGIVKFELADEDEDDAGGRKLSGLVARLFDVCAGSMIAGVVGCLLSCVRTVKINLTEKELEDTMKRC